MAFMAGRRCGTTIVPNRNADAVPEPVVPAPDLVPLLGTGAASQAHRHHRSTDEKRDYPTEVGEDVAVHGCRR